MSNQRYMDRLAHGRAQELQDGVFNHIDALQKADTVEDGYAEMAVAFYMITMTLGLNLSEVLSSASKAAYHAGQIDTEKMQAIRMFIALEMGQ